MVKRIQSILTKDFIENVEFNESTNGTISLKAREKFRLRWNPSQSAIPSIITFTLSKSVNILDILYDTRLDDTCPEYIDVPSRELSVLISKLSGSSLLLAGIFNIPSYGNYLIGGFTSTGTDMESDKFVFIGWEVPRLDENIVSQIKAYIKK